MQPCGEEPGYEAKSEVLIVYILWQSRVEIEHYSVTYFDRVTVLEALKRSTSVKGGAHTRSEAASMPDKST